MKSETERGQEEKCAAIWQSDTMKTAICDGVLKQETRMLRCPQCRKRRKHRWLVRIDSWLTVCKSCGLTRVWGGSV